LSHKRFDFAGFADVRKTKPLGQVPVLHVDGEQVTQSDAILRYAGKLAGKLAGLYPTDAFQALLCDEVMDAVEEVNIKLGATFGLTGDALKDARQALVADPLSKYHGWLQTQLQTHGGQYFADGQMTIADLKVFTFVRGLNSSHLDHVPTDLVAKTAPLISAHQHRVADTPAVAHYHAKFKA
jgi:glutathione S-transferase